MTVENNLSYMVNNLEDLSRRMIGDRISICDEVGILAFRKSLSSPLQNGIKVIITKKDSFKTYLVTPKKIFIAKELEIGLKEYNLII